MVQGWHHLDASSLTLLMAVSWDICWIMGQEHVHISSPCCVSMWITVCFLGVWQLSSESQCSQTERRKCAAFWWPSLGSNIESLCPSLLGQGNHGDLHRFKRKTQTSHYSMKEVVRLYSQMSMCDGKCFCGYLWKTRSVTGCRDSTGWGITDKRVSQQRPLWGSLVFG